MSLISLTLILVSMVGLVAGQLLLKVAMSAHSATPRPRRLLAFAGGIAAMTVWFLLWLGLLARMDLSRLFPFEGLASVLLSLAACVLLKERASRRTWAGIALIAGGVALVALN